MKSSLRLSGAVVLILAVVPALSGDEIDGQLAIVRRVGAGAAGSQEARKACSELAKGGTAILPKLLAAMDTENLVASNWLHTVYDAVIDKERLSGSPKVPVALLKDYVRDVRRQGRVRRQVLDTLDEFSPSFRREFIPSCLEDPEFRIDAVEASLAAGDEFKKQNKNAEAIEAYFSAFRHARESQQITAAADRLAAAGKPVSIVEHMGLVTDWYLLGPFDAPKLTGFALSFPPEKEAGKPIDLKDQYDGQDKRRIGWKRYHTDDRLGLVDLSQGIAPATEAVGYAYAELNSPKAQAAQIRCGADDNLTVWLNGQKVFGREQWLNGIRLDRFVVPVEIKPGTNRLLVKVCQGPHHSNPAVGNAWTLQLRVCTVDGGSAGLTSALPPIAKKVGGK